MKTKSALTAALLTLGLTACTQAPAPVDPKVAAAAQAEKDVADIKAMEDRFLKSSTSKDANAIMAFYVPDESLFVFDVIPPRQYVGAAAYRKDW